MEFERSAAFDEIDEEYGFSGYPLAMFCVGEMVGDGNTCTHQSVQA